MNAITMRTVRAGGGLVRHVPCFAPPAAPARSRKTRPVPDPMKTNGEASAEQLRLLLERIETIEEEKRGIADDLKDVYGEAKSIGFDVSTMKTIIRLRRMESHHREEADMLLETYRTQLGLA